MVGCFHELRRETSLVAQGLNRQLQKYSREIVAEVLAANDIVDVIDACLELKAAGTARFKALCPFHNEKTPSFTVNRDRQMFYCFGCEKGGDAIGFLCEHEGLSFVESLQKLADRAGVRLPALTQRDGADDYRRTELLRLGKFACAFFKDTLHNPLQGSLGRQYLKTRHLKPETVERFALGYAPDEWTHLTDAARAAGFKDHLLEASGLAKRGERGKLYDFFRNRLLIPIRDVPGNLVAFGGRDLGDSPAKYINSPENLVYKKGRVLYGLFEARDALRKEKRALLVEGYFDALRCFDAGIENVVATCGTALTANQAALLRRYVPEVVVVFDTDAAGIRAALRGIGILTAGGLTVRALVLPDGKDPDDYVKLHGAEGFLELVDTALDFVTFYIRMSDERLSTIEGRAEVARELFSILLGIDDQLRRDEYLKRVARGLRLNEWTARAEFGRFLRRKDARRPVAPLEPAAARTLSQDDTDFVAIVLNNEPLLRQTEEALASVELQPCPVAEVLSELFRAPGSDMLQRLQSDQARALYAAAANQQEACTANAESMLRKRIRRLKKEALRAKAARVQQAIEEAERSHNTDRVSELLSQKIGINKQIEEVGAA